MGLFGFFAHRSSKKGIRGNIDWYRSLNSDERAVKVLNIWLSRGINLAELSGRAGLFIPVYFYVRGAEVPLTDLIALFERTNNVPMRNAAQFHLYTNLAVSYPDEGYGELVIEMWDAVLEDHTDLREVVGDIEGFLSKQRDRTLIENNDVSINDLVAKPSSILPHFLVPGHPLSARLLEEGKMGNFILGK